MIRANCRERFTAKDFDFIVEVLGKSSRDKVALTELLTDSGTRDEVLDHEVLFQQVTQKPGFAQISPYLYFYVLTRRVLTEFNLEDRNVADYVASMLSEFCSAKRSKTISHGHTKTYDYLTDMMVDLTNASSYEAFLLRSHLGNYALFLTGIFPDFVYRKSTYGRKAPGFDYYEEMGSRSFHLASRHSVAAKYSLEEILAKLAQHFRHVRIALNRLTDEYLKMDERPERLDKMLRQIFYGSIDPNSYDA